MHYITPVLVLIDIPTSMGKARTMIHLFPVRMGFTIWWRISDTTHVENSITSQVKYAGSLVLYIWYAKRNFVTHFTIFSTICWCREGNFFVTILCRRRVQLREARWLAHGHISGQWQSPHKESSLLVPILEFFPLNLPNLRAVKVTVVHSIHWAVFL